MSAKRKRNADKPKNGQNFDSHSDKVADARSMANIETDQQQLPMSEMSAQTSGM